jgi:hypothetical protein
VLNDCIQPSNPYLLVGCLLFDDDTRSHIQWKCSFACTCAHVSLLCRVIARAIYEFYVAHGRLPVSGPITDMTATTDWYVELQRVFLAQAHADTQAICTTAKSIAASYGITAAQSLSGVDAFEEEVTYMTKYAHGLMRFSTRSCADSATATETLRE